MFYRATMEIPTHPAPFRTAALRELIAKLTRDYGVDADTTADLVLAINEAAIFMLSHAAQGDALKCQCALQTGVLRVMLATRMGSHIPPDPHCFELYIVRRLVDHMDLELPAQSSAPSPTAVLILEKTIYRNTL